MVVILRADGVGAAAIVGTPTLRRPPRAQKPQAAAAEPVGAARLYESAILLALLTVQLPWLAGLTYLTLRLGH